MTLTYDRRKKTFMPFETCSNLKRREIGSSIRNSIDNLRAKLGGAKVGLKDHIFGRRNRIRKQYQDSFDQVLYNKIPTSNS